MFYDIIKSLKGLFRKTYSHELPITKTLSNIYRSRFDNEDDTFGATIFLPNGTPILKIDKTLEYKKIEYFDKEKLTHLYVIPYYIDNSQIVTSQEATKVLYCLVSDILSSMHATTKEMKTVLYYAPILILYEVYNLVDIDTLSEIYEEQISLDFIVECMDIGLFTLLDRGLLYQITDQYKMKYVGVDNSGKCN